MRKYPRIEIDQKAYDGLQIEAVLQHKTVREMATEAILGYVSREALSVLDLKTIRPKTPEDIATERPLDYRIIRRPTVRDLKTSGPQDQKIIETECHAEGEIVVCEPELRPESTPKAKKQRLSQDQEAITRIKELWQSGERNTAKIAKEIHYPKATTRENIKRMKDRGELSSHPRLI